jgi:hypothetical protein
LGHCRHLALRIIIIIIILLNQIRLAISYICKPQHSSFTTSPILYHWGFANLELASLRSMLAGSA